MKEEFDAESDRIVAHIGVGTVTKGWGIEVTIRAYKDGIPKVALSRTNGTKYQKLGRISEAELPTLIELLQQAEERFQSL